MDIRVSPSFRRMAANELNVDGLPNGEYVTEPVGLIFHGHDKDNVEQEFVKLALESESRKDPNFPRAQEGYEAEVLSYTVVVRNPYGASSSIGDRPVRWPIEGTIKIHYKFVPIE